MRNTLGLILTTMLLVGCKDVEREPEMKIAHDNFFIPDSNKQKYADFISSSTASCQKDCDDAIREAKRTAGPLFGEQQYIIWYFGGERIEYVFVSISQMTDKQLELYHKTFKF